MPKKDKDEFLYSQEELSQIFRGAQEAEIVECAVQKGFPQDKTNGLWHLKKDDLKVLSEHFAGIAAVPDNCHSVPDYLKDCTSPWAVTLVKMYQSNVAHPTALSPDQGQFLKSLVCNFNPQTVVEIGSYTGISTIWLASGLEQIGSKATVHAIDIFTEIFPWPPYHYEYVGDTLELAQSCAAAAGLSHRIQFHKSDSKYMAEKLHSIIQQPIDFLFIDGDHSVKGCLTDLLLYYPYVSVGGYIILHDINPEFCGCPGPRYVLDKFVQNSRHFDVIEIKTTPVNHGMAVIRKLSRDPKLSLMAGLLDRAVPVWAKYKEKPIGQFIKKKMPKSLMRQNY